MKTLLLLRHAKSSWKDDSLDDHDRPLNSRGKDDAPRMGELLLELALVPDFVVTSSARRCRKTTDHVSLACGFRGETRITHQLYEASPEAIARIITEVPGAAQRLLLVGHNPGLEQFLEQLTGTYHPLTTAALVHLEVELEDWSQFAVQSPIRLHRIWQPRELP